MNSILNSEVLYFPHIEFYDSTWLKGALCLWERVHRIVPEGYSPKDTDEVKEAIDAGTVVSLRLSQGDLANARTTFADLLATRTWLPHGLDPKGEVSRIHRGKIQEQLQREFEKFGGRPDFSPEWMEMPRGLANGYLLYLAQTVATRRSMPKITDSEAMFVAMQYFATRREYKELVHDLDKSDATAAVAFRGILPGGLESAPMKHVLKFRHDNADGRTAFRQAFQQLAEELANVEEPTHEEEMVRQFELRLKHADGLTIPRIKEHFADTSNLAIQVGLPVTAAGVASLLQADGGSVMIGKLIVQLVGALVGGVAARRKEWRSPEATYLAKMNQEFDGDQMFPRPMPYAANLMDEFLND